MVLAAVYCCVNDRSLFVLPNVHRLPEKKNALRVTASDPHIDWKCPPAAVGYLS